MKFFTNIKSKSLTVKLTLILSLFLVLPVAYAYADTWWEGSGTNIYKTNTDNVGIGTVSPSDLLDVANGSLSVTGTQTFTNSSGTEAGGLFNQTLINNNTNGAVAGISTRPILMGNGNNATGMDIAPTFRPTANVGLARGMVMAAFFQPPTGVTITRAIGAQAALVFNVASGGSIINAETLSVDSPIGALITPATIYGAHIYNQGLAGTTNSYGLYVDSQSGSTNNYAAIFAGGNVGIGTTTPSQALDVNGNIKLNGDILSDGDICIGACN